MLPAALARTVLLLVCYIGLVPSAKGIRPLLSLRHSTDKLLLEHLEQERRRYGRLMAAAAAANDLGLDPRPSHLVTVTNDDRVVHLFEDEAAAARPAAVSDVLPEYNFEECTAQLRCMDEVAEAAGTTRSLHACRTSCRNNDKCNYFTFLQKENGGGDCFHYSTCVELDLRCSNCHTGSGTCRAAKDKRIRPNHVRTYLN